MLRGLIAIALIIVSAVAFTWRDFWDALPWQIDPFTLYLGCAAGYVIGSCWLLYLIRAPGETRPERINRMLLRVLVALPTAILVVQSIIGYFTVDTLSLEGVYYFGPPGAPIWIMTLATWRGISPRSLPDAPGSPS
jgi:Na+/H+ antiporter NhaC